MQRIQNSYHRARSSFCFASEVTVRSLCVAKVPSVQRYILKTLNTLCYQIHQINSICFCTSLIDLGPNVSFSHPIPYVIVSKVALRSSTSAQWILQRVVSTAGRILSIRKKVIPITAPLARQKNRDSRQYIARESCHYERAPRHLVPRLVIVAAVRV